MLRTEQEVQEQKYREQVQEGMRAQECLDYLKPILAEMRNTAVNMMAQEAPARSLQDHLLDCRAAIVGCRKIEDALKGRINTGKLAENNLKDGD